MSIKKVTTLFLLLFFSISFSQEKVLELKSFLTDNGNFFNTTDVISLEEKLKNYHDKTTNQIVVVTIESLEGKNLEQYANKLFNANGVGQEDKDNGVLILISKKERKIRIEVGLGFEHLLTDAVCSRIIREQMTPLFKKRNYYSAVDLGIYSIVSILYPGENIIEKRDASEGGYDWDWLKKAFDKIILGMMFLSFFGGLFFVLFKFVILHVYENLINLIRGVIVGKIGFFKFFRVVTPVYFMLFFVLTTGIIILFVGFIFAGSLKGQPPKEFFGGILDHFSAYKIVYLVMAIIICYVLPFIIAFFNRKQVKDYPLRLSLKSDEDYLKKHLIFSRSGSSTYGKSYSSSGSSSSYSSSSSSSSSFSGGGGSSGGGGASGGW